MNSIKTINFNMRKIIKFIKSFKPNQYKIKPKILRVSILNNKKINRIKLLNKNLYKKCLSRFHNRTN